MAQQLAGDEREVSRGRERPLALAVQTVGIDERCSRAAELARPGVHPLDKGRLGPCQMLRHRDRAVVCRADRDRLEHLVERQLLARLEPDLRAAHRAGVLAARYHGVERHLAALERLHREQHGHDLGHGRRLELLVRVRYIKLLSVRRIQRGRFRVQRPELRQSCRIHEQQTEHRRRADQFFHNRPPLSPHFMRFVCALCLFCIDKRCPAAL